MPGAPAEPRASSTGLSPQLAAVLAYLGWWVSGLIFWWLERDDSYVRFHAAQSVVAFGIVALVVAGFGAMAIATLPLLPSAFILFVWAAGLTWLGGVLLWIAAMWNAARGRQWRIPVASELVDLISRRHRR
jgi:uncharacterized membrane protein